MSNLNPYEGAIRALLPDVDLAFALELDADLSAAERALSAALAEIVPALEALRSARAIGPDSEHPHDSTIFGVLGKALTIARNPGASGTPLSQIERANAALQKFDTTARTLSRFGA